ncbi:MAG: PAS domain S-box protein [Moraxellaceae bacterium]|nr:MAG: PAS domain S-box protein [Moraxellaceae bacterium]
MNNPIKASELFITLASMTATTYAYAGPISYFKNADGSTKWQYVANFSSSILIITLLIVTVFLFFANRRAVRSNRELTEIKATLEDRVARRTASLEETTAHLKNREAYISSIVDSMPLMLIGLNQNMEITQWNHVAEAITGRPIATVLGKNLWDAYPAITLSPTQVKNVLHRKETKTIKHSQHGQYYFDITLYALTDKSESETGIVILVDDITHQMKAETKLAERDKVSAMGELASAMAYDINSPLQTISSTLLNAQDELATSEYSGDKEELVRAIEIARQSSQQTSSIIQNLLDLANSNNEEKKLADVAKIMDRSLELAATLFKDASGLSFEKISISRDYNSPLPKISCFTSEIQQVFVRLLRQAFHSLNASTKNGNTAPTIHVEVGEFYDSVWIKVQHNGKALSPDQQHDIFQPFFSMESSVSACPVEHRLSYSYFIITDHHHGQMAVTSDENFGTTFNIQLPKA